MTLIANRLQARLRSHPKAAPFERNDAMLEAPPIGSCNRQSSWDAADYGTASPSAIRFFFDSPCETMKCDSRM